VILLNLLMEIVATISYNEQDHPSAHQRISHMRNEHDMACSLCSFTADCILG
jgi:hypothetical protein